MASGTECSPGRVWIALVIALACGCGADFGGSPESASVAVNSPASPSAFVAVNSPAAPRVAYALKQHNGTIFVYLDIDHVAGSVPLVELGLAGRKPIRLGSDSAKTAAMDGRTRFSFTIKKLALAEGTADLEKFRMGISVRWPGGVAGKDRRIERYLHTDPAAAHSGLSPDVEHWTLINFRQYTQLVEDRRLGISLSVKQPMDGKLTVVIEDSKGRRVRNLLGGAQTGKGVLTVDWDGTADDGNLVMPGTYRWRSAHHPGIKPHYLTSFCNGGEKDMFSGFGSNHSRFVHAASNSRYAFIAAPLTEGGWEMIAVDDNGKWQKGFQKAHGTPLHGVQVVADEKIFYAVHDGLGWGEKIDKNNPKWKCSNKITLTRFNIETTKPIDYPGRKHFIQIGEYEHGPGAADEKMRSQYSVAGAALLEGMLYVACRHLDEVLIVDPEDGRVKKRFPLNDPRSLASHSGRLYAVTGDSVLSFGENGEGMTKVLSPTGLDIHGLALDPAGNIYLTDHTSHTVRIFAADGSPVGSLGKPGGPYKGKYDKERMVLPLGMAVKGNRLWVTEDRWNPKRVLAWDLDRGKVALEKFGNPSYGSSGGGFDPDDHTRWLGLGAGWKVNLEGGKDVCASVMNSKRGHLDGYYKGSMRYTFHKQGGRTFLLGSGKIGMVSELMDDGSVRDLAAVANLHLFSYACGWKLPPALEAVLPEKYLKMKEKRYRTNESRNLGVMWVDENGDGALQKNEFSFHEGPTGYAASWGNNQRDLTLRFPLQPKGEAPRILVLRPDGFHPGGAPKYPALSDAVARAVPWKETMPLDYRKSSMPTTVDRWNNLIYNTSPQMVAVAPDGKRLWQYPNNWVGVHGSHRAPLPEAGVMQGNLFFLGCAPLDEASDVFVLNGNHGRFSVLTSDGLYLDEMFRDVRTGRDRNALMVGGEPFGGFFARSRKDDAFYLQTGGDGYRIYRLSGLHELKRGSGKITVTKEQIMAAERKLARKRAEGVKKKEAVVLPAPKKHTIDGRDHGWQKNWTVEWDRNGQFPVKVKCAHDGDTLYLYYNVYDESPWVNNGKDWTTLFKTGDSVDLQIGTDRSADPTRRGPAPGDVRLLIAPFEGKPIVVLYRHRVKDGKNPVTFTSPWRSETVDVVEKLEAVQVKVDTGDVWYRLEAAVPLKALGLVPVKGKEFKADFGVIYGDRDGTINFLRSYWANQATMLVNDVPGEIMLTPNQWGRIRFE